MTLNISIQERLKRLGRGCANDYAGWNKGKLPSEFYHVTKIDILKRNESKIVHIQLHIEKYNT